MGRLIDDLLEFSRLGREPLKTDTVGMSTLARNVADNLRAEDELAIGIGDLPSVHGDATLLRQVWENLISNAIKYSRKQACPTVRISGEVANGEATYCVEDNGVGFDMQYADKLFGVFQRLHHGDEFTGTGVGLATVKRIVLRHGGRVWADGRIGSGARFYFALPVGAR
jgi:light-regulated signal transduction histidine kinase (bacteriophytochrome)